jgi:trimethylamine--corrinoid protein Co-methyltransferase
MKAQLRVLSSDECVQVHEQSLKILAGTGVKVLSEQARQLLGKAGAEVTSTTQIVRFPRPFVEASLAAAPKGFKLGGRRPGWDLEMNIGKCSLLADGGAVNVLDFETGEIRAGTFKDWLDATHLIDVMDEIGIYWNMVEGGFASNSLGDFIAYWRNVLKHCSKHIQDSTDDPQKSKLLLEVLQIVFGDKDAIRRTHPYSHILCPMSPLVIDRIYTDAYLALVGWNIPVALMPMPLMGSTGPASMISNIVLANSEALAALCLVQAAEPGTPVIYATIPQSLEPFTWRYTGGAVENSIFGAATTEMGRYYGLPVEASTGGTDQFYPGAQASYERAINWTLPTIAWPDILVGPGLLAGSTTLCLEQMVMDVEIFRRCSRLYEGANRNPERWLDDALEDIRPGQNFLAQKSTLKAVKEGRWYLSGMGFHDTYEKWKAADMPDIIDEIQGITRGLLKKYRPLPLDENADRELEKLEQRVRQSAG